MDTLPGHNTPGSGKIATQPQDVQSCVVAAAAASTEAADKLKAGEVRVGSLMWTRSWSTIRKIPYAVSGPAVKSKQDQQNLDCVIADASVSIAGGVPWG